MTKTQNLTSNEPVQRKHDSAELFDLNNIVLLFFELATERNFNTKYVVKTTTNPVRIPKRNVREITSQNSASIVMAYEENTRTETRK